MVDLNDVKGGSQGGGWWVERGAELVVKPSKIDHFRGVQSAKTGPGWACRRMCRQERRVGDCTSVFRGREGLRVGVLRTSDVW